MYEVTVEGRFSGAHRHATATADPGVHGHDFLVLVRIVGDDLVDDVLVDFHDVELALQRELVELNYSDLDQHKDFAPGRATPAAIARWLFRRLDGAVAGPLKLASVEVRDTEQTGGRYELSPLSTGRY